MDYSKAEKMDVSAMSCHDIFREINDRMIVALMFHDQMADMYDFLGLNGFKRMHEYQHLSESAERRGLKRYYINHHNKLLIGGHVSDPDVIPDEWVKYKRHEVSPQVRKQSVEKSFDMYRHWEHETKECYEKYAKALFDMGHVADAHKVECLVCDVDMELKCIDRMILSLRAVAYNEVYIVTIQDVIHEKYDKKTQEIGIHIC